MDLTYFTDYHNSKYKVNPPRFEHIWNMMKSIQESGIDFSKKVNIKKSDNGTHPEIIKLKNALEGCNPSYNSQLSEAFILIQDFQCVENINSTENFIKELKEIAEDPKNSKFNISDNYFSFDREIEMYFAETDSRFNFGTFHIFMYYDKVIIKPVKNNTVKNDYCVHPYVSTDGYYRLCIGDYKTAYSKFWKSKHMKSCLEIVLDVLTIYGGNEGGAAGRPHQGFTLWAGVECIECGDNYPLDKMNICSTTKTNICPKCSENLKCEYSGKHYVSMLLDKCDSCGKKTTGIKTKNKQKICTVCRATGVFK